MVHLILLSIRSCFPLLLCLMQHFYRKSFAKHGAPQLILFEMENRIKPVVKGKRFLILCEFDTVEGEDFKWLVREKAGRLSHESFCKYTSVWTFTPSAILALPFSTQKLLHVQIVWLYCNVEKISYGTKVRPPNTFSLVFQMRVAARGANH